MIQIEHISYTFQKGSPQESKAISDFSLQIPRGEFLIVMGSNGSGKSTIMNLLAGSLIPESGTISIDRQEITQLSEYKRCKWISRIFQNPLHGTAPDLSILENFRLASLRTRVKGLQIGTDEAFRKTVREQLSILELGLESKLDQAMGSLSGGQRQALTLIMAVMDEARILLLDEPAAALDPKTSELFMQLAARLIRERNLTAILITHQLKDALLYGDRIIHLQNGKIVRDVKGDKKRELTRTELFSWFGD